MSRASAYVKFPDGTVRAGIYNGTVDWMFPWLWDTSDEAWDHYTRTYADRGPEERSWSEPPEGEVVDVVIYSDYGRGSYWPGRAAKNVIVDGLNPWDEDIDEEDGQPEWLPGASVPSQGDPEP